MSGIRVCIPEPFGRRGAGLGNELFAWAKAFLASQALGLKMLGPAWGLNRRGYHRYFRTSRADWIAHALLRGTMPLVRFDENAYRATGEEDFVAAVLKFAADRGLERRRHYVLQVGGMWGGFLAIRKARLFVLGELLKARGSVTNVHRVLSRRDPRRTLIAVHLRRGDFLETPVAADFRGRFSVGLPLEWYVETCRSLRSRLAGTCEFLLLTDAPVRQVAPFLDEFNPLTTFDLRDTACSDLLLMAFSDCLVCSLSSFSMWGAFLSGAPYLWFAPNLQDHGGFGSIWGNEAAQRAPFGVTARNLECARNDATQPPRGIPVPLSGDVPDSFVGELKARMGRQRIDTDLLYYGVVASPQGGPVSVT